jgi:hypothetical protein
MHREYAQSYNLGVPITGKHSRRRGTAQMKLNLHGPIEGKHNRDLRQTNPSSRPSKGNRRTGMFGRTCTLIVLLAGLAGIGGGIAAPQGAVTRYLIVSGDSISGSWDFRDEHLIERLRSQYGNHFVWFRQAAHDYVGSGDSLLVDIEAAMAPQREVNRQQNDVNRHQNESEPPAE